jgi:hypothetical protein
MPDYSKGKVYTIRCRTDDTLIYVGSTTQSLAKRWGGHKVDSITEKCQNRLIYKTMNNNWDNWYYELYELYPCSCKEELCKREGEIIRLIGTLNGRIEGRTIKEWRDDNAEKIKLAQKESDKLSYQKHREKRLEAARQYYINNKEAFKEYYAKRQANKKDVEVLNPV